MTLKQNKSLLNTPFFNSHPKLTTLCFLFLLIVLPLVLTALGIPLAVFINDHFIIPNGYNLLIEIMIPLCIALYCLGYMIFFHLTGE